MKESITISVISKIYSIISRLFFVFIVSIILFFGILLYGIKIDSIHTENVTIEKLYIKWDEKLLISAKKIQIISNHKKSLSTKVIDQKTLFHFLSFGNSLFQSIDIEQLLYDQYKISINYQQKKGEIILRSPQLNLSANTHLNQDKLYIKITSLSYLPLELKAKGKILFEKSKKLLTTNLKIDIMNQAYFALHSTLQNNILNYNVQFLKPIKDSSSILNKLNLPKPVQYWAITAIDAKNIVIEKLKGSFNITNPSNALQKIYVKAIANQLKYTYNPKLAPIDTQYTILEFKKGILYIYPKKAKTYGYDLQNSYLKIDFLHKPEELLTLYLKFQKGKLDKNILHILSTYGIDVPLMQKEGITSTDLKITVSLRNINVNAKGKFYVKKGRFLYLGMDIDVANVLVFLNNSHIQVKKMSASLKDMIQSDVDIDLQLAQHTGKIDFNINKLELAPYDISLKGSKPYQVSYIINKQGTDTIKIPKTLWNFHNTNIEIQPLNIDFDFSRYVVNIPLTSFSINKQGAGYINGILDLQKDSSKIDIDIIKYKSKSLELAQSNYHITILKKEKLTTISTTPLQLYINQNLLSLNKLHFTINHDYLLSNKIDITYGKNLSASLLLKENINNATGYITLLNSQFSLDNFHKIFYNNKKLKLKFFLKNGFKLSSSDLQAVLYYKNTHTNIKLTSLKKIVPYSELLQKYKIQNGKISFSSDNGLNAEITSLYKLIRINEKAINTYKIKSSQSNKNRFIINNHIFIDFNKHITITGNNIGIDIDQMQKLMKLIDSSNTNSSSNNLFIKLTNGYLYITKSRRILYDLLAIQSLNKIITAQLNYKEGKAGFRYHNDKFYLYGSNFNDTFMSNLFLQSKFKKGKLNFSILGSFEEYKGIFEIVDTTVLDYKILTNILAFIDTVPSLMTFSLPKYSTEGLYVHKAYASFYYKNGIFTFDNVNLDSDQIDIVGAGTASYVKDYIDFVFQLKTNIASKMSKIPLVGYILFDGKTISTTLKVEGKLTDPKVSTMLAQSIIVAPINIIKRTILLPVHLLGLDKEKKETNR